MSNKPLQYESLKAVIQYLEPNLRFVLALRIPSIRLTEKVVPIHIEHLRFGFCTTQVNNTVYTLVINRMYPDGQLLPETGIATLPDGGIQCDKDKYGFDDWSENMATPGDVDIRYNDEFDNFNNRIRDNLRQGYYEKHVALYVKALSQRLALGDAHLRSFIGPVQFPLFRAQFYFPLDDEDDPLEEEESEEAMLEQLRDISLENLQMSLVHFRDMLLPYYCRRDNVAPPFIPFIQLSIDSPNGKQIHRFSYNKKLFEAWKSLNSIFFGNRRPVIQARKLGITRNQLKIRLPIGFKIRVKQLQIDGNIKVFDPLKQIVEDDSFPLNHLCLFHNDGNIGVYESDKVKTAKHLNIEIFSAQIQQFLPVLLGLQNQKVSLELCRWVFPVADQLRLVEHWIETDKPVGASLLYGQKEEDTCKELLAQAKDRFLGEMQDDRSLRIPMNNSKVIEIVYTRIENVEITFIRPVREEEKPKWNVKMRVVESDVE